jgi:hypothetical protein
MSHIFKSQYPTATPEEAIHRLLLDDALDFSALDEMVQMSWGSGIRGAEHSRVVLGPNEVEYVCRFPEDPTIPGVRYADYGCRVTAHEVSHWTRINGEVELKETIRYVRRSFEPTYECNPRYETDVLRVASVLVPAFLGSPRRHSFFNEEGGGYCIVEDCGIKFYTETLTKRLPKLIGHVRTEHNRCAPSTVDHYDGHACQLREYWAEQLKECCRHLVRTEWRDGTIEYYERGKHVRTQKPDGSVLVIVPDRDYRSEAAELRRKATRHMDHMAYHEKQRADCERLADEAEAAAERAEAAAAGVEEAAAGVEEGAAARAEEKPAAAVEMPAAAASALSNNHVLLWLGCTELPGDDLLPLLYDDGPAGTHQRARFCTRHKVEDHSEGCGRRAHYRAAFTPTCQKCLFVRKYFGR